MGLNHGRSRSDSSSSGEEDGDANWRAAIDSVANGFTNANSTKPKDDSNPTNQEEDDGDNNTHKPQPIKLYQIKAQKLLEDLVEKSLVVVKDSVSSADNEPMLEEGGIRLFRQAPPGICCDPIDEFQKPRKRPKILPGEVIDEKSKKFKSQLQSVAVDGINIIAAARDACQKSLARLEAKNAAAKAAAKQEEKRVAELKKIRGEKWLPSIAKGMLGSK